MRKNVKDDKMEKMKKLKKKMKTMKISDRGKGQGVPLCVDDGGKNNDWMKLKQKYQISLKYKPGRQSLLITHYKPRERQESIFVTNYSGLTSNIRRTLQPWIAVNLEEG